MSDKAVIVITSKETETALYDERLHEGAIVNLHDTTKEKKSKKLQNWKDECSIEKYCILNEDAFHLQKPVESPNTTEKIAQQNTEMEAISHEHAICNKMYKRERWDAINELMKKISKSKSLHDGENARSCSDEEVEDVEFLAQPAQRTGSKDDVSHTNTSFLYKRERWAAINELIRKHKTLEITREGNTKGICYSPNIEWDELELLLQNSRKTYELKPLNIPQPEVDALISCMVRTVKVFGGVYLAGNEAKLQYFLAPIFTYVCNLFRDGIHLLVQETVNGERLQTKAYFDFLICRGNKRVGVIQAVQDDMEQGLVKCVLGCEVLSDVERLPVVYGIVTNYSQWIFVRSDTDYIYEHYTTLEANNYIPTMEGLQTLAGKIYSILLE